MNFKRIISIVLTFLIICSAAVFAEDVDVSAGLLGSQNDTVNQMQQTQENSNENTLKVTADFTDVPKDASYYEDVKKLAENGIINGYEDGTFRPDNYVTRAEACKMINLSLRYTSTEGAVGFPDVNPNDWYYNYAVAAQKAGYIEGYEDGSFRAANNITRQEVCAILCRLLKPMDLGLDVTVNDKVADWAKEYVRLVVQNYLMPLEENNTFRATENIKRYELASVLSGLVIGPVETITANVRFFVDGVQYGETQTLAVGTLPVLPEDPKSKEGLYFAGWRAKGTEDVVEADSIYVTADIDYEAVFTEVMYTVKFYNRGALYDTKQVAHKSIVKAPASPVVEGFTFMGWGLNETGPVIKLNRFIITEDTKLHAVFQKGNVEVEPEDPTEENPKEENPKEEDPKEEDPKEEDPKDEDPKEEDPKDEEPKDEDPKDEDPKEEDPKEEDPKDEDPKDEDPKEEDPKEEDPKDEDPKEEDPKDEDPKDEDPKDEDPKDEDPKDEDPKEEDPKEEDPKEEDPKDPVTPPEDDEEEEDETVYWTVMFIYPHVDPVYREVVNNYALGFPPEIPEYKGHRFLGWSLRDQGEKSKIIDDVENMVVTGYLDLYAVYVKNDNSEQLLNNLREGTAQLQAIRMSNSLHKKARSIIVECLKSALYDAETTGVEITKQYLYDMYGDKISEAKDIVNNQMSDDTRSTFANLITSKVSKEIRDFLTEYFNININI